MGLAVSFGLSAAGSGGDAKLTAPAADTTRPASSTVRVTDHNVPAVSPDSANDSSRTLLDLFNSWIGDKNDSKATTTAVKVDPRPVQDLTAPAVVPPPADGPAIVPIDPEPSAGVAHEPDGAPTSLGLAGSGEQPKDAEPLGVLTTHLVSTSLVASALWGKPATADRVPVDELALLASYDAERLERPRIPAPRRLMERARPPLKAGRVETTTGALNQLTPVDPTPKTN